MIALNLKTLLAAGALAALNAMAQAPAVKIDAAWARATVPGQKGTGAFMTMTAQQGLRPGGVASPGWPLYTTDASHEKTGVKPRVYLAQYQENT